MKPATVFLALSAMMLLTACASGRNDLAKLSRAQAVGSPYTRALALEYHTLASAHRWTWVGSASRHLARKGLAAADGILVLPESPRDWRWNDKNNLELSAAHAALIGVLEGGAPATAPEKTAYTQARFDCWLLQKNDACKQQFSDALQSLKKVMTTPPPPRTASPLPPAAPLAEEFPPPILNEPKGANAPLQQAMFLVFFDWNRYALSGNSTDVLDAIALELNTRRDIKQIVVVGHADTSGSASYNKKLSLQRAAAVRDALTLRGIAPAQLRIEGRGEDALLVQTPDNMREPANRRAQITLE